MDKFKQLHKQHLKDFKKLYANDLLSEEYFRKNINVFIAKKNFIERHITKPSYDFQDSEYFFVEEHYGKAKKA